MMRTFALVALGWAGGVTSALALLAGARRANAPRPRPHVEWIRTDTPIDWTRLARIEGDAAR